MIRSINIWQQRPIIEDRLLLKGSAIALALGTGFVIATQPLETSIVILGALVLVVLSFVTPLLPVIALLVIAPLRALVATEATVNLPLDPGQLMVVFVAGVWFIWHVAIRREPVRFRWSPLFIPLALFILITGLSGFNAWSISTWMTEWLKWILIGLIVLLVLITPISRQVEWLAFGLVMAGVANALVGMFIFLGGSGADHLLINNRFFRAFGTFGQPNPFGGFMGIIAPIAIMMSVAHLQVLYAQWRVRQVMFSTWAWGAFYSISAGILVLGIFISWSRGAWLGFVISLFVLIIGMPRKPSIAIACLAGTLLASTLIWTSGLVPQSIATRINSATQEAFTLNDVRAVDITGENFAIVERIAHWQAAYNMAEDHFWLGVGFGNYEIAYAEHQLINWDEPLGHAHNYYLNIFGEAGILGLTAYVVMLAAILWITWRASHHPDPIAHALCVGILGSWVYLMAHSLTDNLYVNNMFLHLGAMLGVIAVLHNETRAVKVTDI